MKKNVIFILLLTILSSCKSEYEEYSGTDAIYLNEISDTVRFSFTYVDSEYETQAQDIHLKVIGKVADYDRPVNIKFTPVNAVEGVDFEPLEKEYVVKKGEVSLVIPVTMIRTKALQTEEKGIDMELLPNGHFTTYYDYGSSDSTSWVKTQRLKLILLFSEFMNEPPSQWNPYMFGEFSAKKFALICDEMDIPREEFNKKSEEAGYILSRMGYIGSYMKKYLADEKAAGRAVYEEDGITEMTMGPQPQ